MIGTALLISFPILITGAVFVIIGLAMGKRFDYDKKGFVRTTGELLRFDSFVIHPHNEPPTWYFARRAAGGGALTTRFRGTGNNYEAKPVFLVSTNGSSREVTSLFSAVGISNRDIGKRFPLKVYETGDVMIDDPSYYGENVQRTKVWPKRIFMGIGIGCIVIALVAFVLFAGAEPMY